MAATPKRSLVVQVAFTVEPADPNANTGRVVDALMDVLGDVDASNAEPGFTVKRTRWITTNLEERAR